MCQEAFLLYLSPKPLHMKHYSLWALLAGLLLLNSCGTTLPAHSGTVKTKITTGPGSEDIVLDESTGLPRLIVSCSQRRKDSTQYGGFWAINPATSKALELPVKGMPDTLIVNPHGIDLAYNNKGIPFLYAVNHQKVPGSKTAINSIMVFKVKTDRLEYVANYTNKHLVSPNDVAALPDGSFYVTNDSKKKKIGLGWVFEKMFKVRSSKIAYRDAAGNWSYVGNKRLAYANGIQAFEDRVLVSATQKKDLAIFARDPKTGALTLTKDIKVAGGLDNITMVDESHVLIASHPSFGEFIKHAKDPDCPSSGIIHLVDLNTGSNTVVYANDGTAISTNSVALYYKGSIYIGQVFQGFVLVVKPGIAIP